MKKILAFLCLSFVGQILNAQEGGINFESGSWATILEKARVQKKLIFVDVYTDWCGPCKKMDAEVFPMKRIGDKFNASFINYKLDAEKGEGPGIKEKYFVRSYPNYLFINQEGILIYRSTSAMPVADFIQVANNALLESKQSETIVELDNLYPTSKDNKAFMLRYLQRRTILRLDNAFLLNDYLNMLTVDERNKLESLQLIWDNGSFLAKNVLLGIATETLQENKPSLALLRTDYRQSLDQVLNVAAMTTLSKAIQQKNIRMLQQVIDLRPGAGLAVFTNKQTASLDYLYGTNQREKYIKTARDYVASTLMTMHPDSLKRLDKVSYDQHNERLQSDTSISKEVLEEYRFSYLHTQTVQLINQLNSFATNLGNVAYHPADLKAAISWIEQAVNIAQINPKYFEQHLLMMRLTKAKLLYKLGDKKAAVRDMEATIAGLKIPGARKIFEATLTKMKEDEPFEVL